MTEIKTDALDALVRDVNYLKYARQLLGEVWDELGPYGLPERTVNDRVISMELVNKLQRFFNFDDSE